MLTLFTDLKIAQKQCHYQKMFSFALSFSSCRCFALGSAVLGCIFNFSSSYFFSPQAWFIPCNVKSAVEDPAVTQVRISKRHVKSMNATWSEYLVIQARFSNILQCFVKSRSKKNTKKAEQLQQILFVENKNNELLKFLTLSFPFKGEILRFLNFVFLQLQAPESNQVEPKTIQVEPSNAVCSVFYSSFFFSHGFFSFMKDVVSTVLYVAFFCLSVVSNSLKFFGAAPYKLVFIALLLLPSLHFGSNLNTIVKSNFRENVVQLRNGFIPIGYSPAPMTHVHAQHTRDSLLEFVYPR